MPDTQVVKSHWRKLMDAWREAAKDRMIPEYRDDEERNHNHRYYR